MVKISVTTAKDTPKRSRSTIEPLVLADLGGLQEGQDLDFKRSIEIDKLELKSRLVGDVVAFLNRGAGRIIIGVEEKQGRFDSFRPLSGDADKITLMLQTMIQDRILPVPVDVQVVPVHLESGFIIDIQIPRHRGGPFMDRSNGSYLVRSGARNLPIDPGMLRSSFIDELAWMTRLDELTAAEDEGLAESGRMIAGQALRIGILPREHFDHLREPFQEDGPVRTSGPHFHEHSRQWFKTCEDGHEAISIDFNQRGIERLFIRDDWFVHAYAGYAIGVTQGEGRLMLGEFDKDFERYMQELAVFFAEKEIVGPFAVTVALQALNDTDPMRFFFPRGATVRTLRPRLVDALDAPELIADFKRRVRQACAYG